MTEYCILEDRAVIEVNGADAFTFLQSQITNDLTLLDHQDSIFCLFLNPTGRFLFDSFISKYTDGYLLEVNKEASQKLLQRLIFYKLRADVVFNLREGYNVIYSRDKSISNPITIYHDNRYFKLGFRSIVPNALELSGTLTSQLYLEDKYNFVIPDGFTDFIYEKSLPPEFSAEDLQAISYSKGCYTGQEVISRAKYQGVVRKRLYGLEFENHNENNLSSLEVFQESTKIGIITSNWQDQAIALLKTELLDVKKEVEVSSSKANIKTAPWIK